MKNIDDTLTTIHEYLRHTFKKEDLSGCIDRFFSPTYIYRDETGRKKYSLDLLEGYQKLSVLDQYIDPVVSIDREMIVLYSSPQEDEHIHCEGFKTFATEKTRPIGNGMFSEDENDLIAIKKVLSRFPNGTFILPNFSVHNKMKLLQKIQSLKNTIGDIENIGIMKNDQGVVLWHLTDYDSTFVSRI